jgi:uncharacterized protein YcbK (DUF882 family)
MLLAFRSVDATYRSGVVVLPDSCWVKSWKFVLGVPAGKAESLSVMKLFVRCAILSIAALALAGCKSTKGPHKLGAGVADTTPDMSWKQGISGKRRGYDREPETPYWLKRTSKKKSKRSRIGSIRHMAKRLAPAGVNVSTLSRMVGKRRQAKIGCFPADLRMLINTVAWHYGKRVHIQSGFRSKHHNRRIGGARGSYHVKCQAVDIQVRGVNKYALAKYLKTLPGRGGVGTYCNVSTVHIDIGPRRAWHYGCRKKSRRRYARKRR